MLLTMSKREHESNDFNYNDSGRPLKRLRMIEADIGSLPDEVIEKILLLIPTHYMLACVCRQWASFLSGCMFWRISCIDRWGADIYPNTLGAEVISYDPQFIVPLKGDLRVDWRAYYLTRDNMETFIAFHNVTPDSGKGSSNANSSELVVSNIIKWITNESYKVGIDIENVKRLRVQLSMRILEILFEQDRDPNLVLLLLGRSNAYCYKSSWLCHRLLRICQLMLDRVEKQIENDIPKFNSNTFQYSYNWLQNSFSLIEEMNRRECEIFAEMIRLWVVWHCIRNDNLRNGLSNNGLNEYIDTHIYTDKYKAMQRVYFEIISKVLLNDETEVSKIQLCYLKVYNHFNIHLYDSFVLKMGRKSVSNQENQFCYDYSWLCTRLLRICQKLLDRVEKGEEDIGFGLAYNLLERCFSFIEEMNERECEIFAEMIRLWVFWHCIRNDNLNNFLDTTANSITKNKAMQLLYFDIANKILGDKTEDPKIQLGYLKWSDHYFNITGSDMDALTQLFALNRSACLSKHEMIRKKALWGLANIAGALDKFKDERVTFSYKKIYDELQTSTDIAGMFDAFARIVDLGTQSLDDEKIAELNKSMADTIDSSNRLNDDNVDDDCGSEEDEDEDELDYWSSDDE